MKLYDQILTRGAEPAHKGDGDYDLAVKNFATMSPTVVDISNVADYYVTFGKTWDDLPSFPIAVSPWPWAFVEYRKPMPTPGPAGRIGAMLMAVPVGDGLHFHHATFVWQERFDPGPPTAYGISTWFTDANGRPIVDDHAEVEKTLAPETLSELREFLAAPEEAKLLAPNIHVGRGHEDYEADMLRTWNSVLWLALSFAHCKNVKIIDQVTPLKVAKKRIANGKPVGVTYKTLVIDGMKETLRTEGGSAHNGLKKALHICRGHFATYTADRPLFGKITGTVWKPMHTRGTKERGEVRKD